MKTLALYGKGGSGKSTVTANLTVQFARSARRPIQIGCDPKRDSTLALMGGRSIPSVVSLLRTMRADEIQSEDFVFAGTSGTTCIEAGGPEAGVGCAGRGIVSVLQLIKKHNILADYDVALLDVLGDVVCGGFAAPLMHGMGSTVAIVVGDNIMSMYAANNICRAVNRFERNGTHLAGIIANNVRHTHGSNELHAFAERLNTRVLDVIPNDRQITEAERNRVVVSELYPEGAASQLFARLAETLWTMAAHDCETPTPMDDLELDTFFRSVMGSES